MRIVAFDTETGGLDHTREDILTAYFAVLDDSLNVIDELDLKLKPDNNREPVVTEGAMKVNGIDLKKHMEDPATLTYSEAKKAIALFLVRHLENKKKKSLVAAGHNIPFDIGFLQHHILPKTTWDQFFSHRSLDTMPIAVFLKFVQWWPEEIGSLSSIVKHLNLPVRNAHNAKDDTLMFVDVLRAILKIFKDKKSHVAGIDLSAISSVER